MATVAVIDIGSNSIKALIAAQAAGERIIARRMRTIEARISAGIGDAHPRLAPEGIARGVDAVRELAAEASAFGPDRTVIVATSAVRDASNGPEFCERAGSAAGHTVRVLTGEEEANLIGRGLLCDPLLAGFRDFYVFDLGGGSLECLAFRDRRIAQAASLPLGCVRLTERFVRDPAQPFDGGAGAAIAAHVRRVVAGANFSLAAATEAVGTGGTLTNLRSVLAARSGQTLEQSDPRLAVGQLRETLERVAAMPLAERRKVAGLPPERADVFPAALAALVALAEIGGFQAFQHSLYNLRWGVAAEALEGLA
jgi:exopolyphosphatase/guanosine-5'-triphosphate,3'-diphosphate pyrophosphatase